MSLRTSQAVTDAVAGLSAVMVSVGTFNPNNLC